MLDQITCLVVDDDRVDGLTVLAFLRDYPFMRSIGHFHSAETALPAALENPPDVLFLDIDMPGMSGLKLREQLPGIPACIFITSYPDYALEGFEMAALDFILKPFSADRFEKTVHRIRDFIQLHRRSDLLSHTLGSEAVLIKEGHDRVKVRLDEIMYLEALNNYTSIITRNRKYTVLSPISSLLKEKPFHRFIRIHRSYAVQKNFITRISTGEVLVNDRVLPVGRTYKDALHELNN
jgi:two-component system LytT family response regulator